MEVILENFFPKDYKHFDMWLKARVRQGKNPAIHLGWPLAGYGHRMSQTCEKGPVFGGAWVPEKATVLKSADGWCTRSWSACEGEVLACCPPAITKWVTRCRDVCPDIKREDRAPFALEYPKVDETLFSTIGIYELSSQFLFLQKMESEGGPVIVRGDIPLVFSVPMQRMIAEKPQLRYAADALFSKIPLREDPMDDFDIILFRRLLENAVRQR